MKSLGRMIILPRVPSALSGLRRLARNARWTWDPRIRDLFRRLDPDGWARHRVPVAVLNEIDQARLDRAASDASFVAEVRALVASLDGAATPNGWTVTRSVRDASQPTDRDDGGPLCIAYFCAEYGWHEKIATYSGGLGILAGDHTKAASDLGLPMVAIGLWYRDGYFRQTLDVDGRQTASTHRLSPQAQGFEPLVGADGEPLEVTVSLWGRPVALRAWTLDVGTVPVWLLDVDVESNSDEDRSWLTTLYGGDRTTRIVQEVILGIGGVRMLRAAGIEPTCWHMNEGHSAFLALERCRELVEQGVPFDVARACVASDTVFTVHTPVPAGNDAFDEALVLDVLRSEWPSLAIGRDAFLACGRFDHGWGPAFSMPALALRFSSFRNGVAALHGQTSRRAWRSLWPGRRPFEVPIDHVTNGVHVDTWVAPRIAAMVERARTVAGTATVEGPTGYACVRDVDLAEAWTVRQEVRAEAAAVWVRRAEPRWRRLGMTSAHGEAAAEALTAPEVLTIGFARRFATYKRAHLIAHDLERLARLLSIPGRPVRLLFAGKAHPADEAGRATIESIARLERDPRFAGKVFLIEDYDMELGRALTRGVDVWLNNPRRPLEASGTSGQKAAMNGVLNLSILDGWWPEGYDGVNGWAIPHVEPTNDPSADDAAEAEALYDVLERDVVPAFWDRAGDGVPRRWMERALDAIATVTPAFSARRMVSDYVARAYLPASRRGRALRAANHQQAFEITSWTREAHAFVRAARLTDATTVPRDATTGEAITFRARLRLGDAEILHPDAVVEAVVARNLDGDDRATVVPLSMVATDASGEAIFEGAWVPTSTGEVEYGVRLEVRRDGDPPTWDPPAVAWA